MRFSDDNPPLGAAVGKGIGVAPKMLSGGSVSNGTAVSVGGVSSVGGAGVLVMVGSGVLVTVGAFESANTVVDGSNKRIKKVTKAKKVK
jgi:hypothetical protein